jgi:outer membrane protein assembly factor BamE (lipoprotein component of BamABCDE complex)
LFLVFLLLVGCNTQAQEPEQASRSYKAHRDYPSLEIISGHLRKGMERSEVEDLLGEPEYSPLAGQEYYSSDRRETVRHGKQEVQIPVGLVVDYRDEQGRVTEQVQKFRLGRIGE